MEILPASAPLKARAKGNSHFETHLRADLPRLQHNPCKNVKKTAGTGKEDRRRGAGRTSAMFPVPPCARATTPSSEAIATSVFVPPAWSYQLPQQSMG